MDGFKLKGIPVNGGRSGVYQVLALMKRLADSHSLAAPLVAFARSLVQDLPQKDRSGEVGAVFSFVQSSIRYVRDPLGAEWLQAPLATLELRAGDCDDKSILLASLLNAIGYQTRFRAVGAVPGRIGHVFVEVLMGGEWVALDATEPHNMGWTPPGSSDFELSEVSGLGWSVSSAIKKVSSGVKKAGSILKKAGSTVKAAPAAVLSPVMPLASPVIAKTVGSEEFQAYAPQVLKLVPVVGPVVGTAIQTAVAVEKNKAAAEALADQAAREELAALKAEEAAAVAATSGALSLPLILGLAAAAAIVAALAARR